MATILSSLGFELSLRWLFENQLPLGNARDSAALSAAGMLADGAGADQAEVVWHDRRTLAGSQADDLSLAGGLVDAFGNVVELAAVKAVALRNRGADDDDVLAVGGHDTAPWLDWVAAAGDIVRVGPRGLLLLWNPSAAGYGVTPETADVLRIENTGNNTIEYDVVIVGTRA
jgi:hypothetical protein